MAERKVSGKVRGSPRGHLTLESHISLLRSRPTVMLVLRLSFPVGCHPLVQRKEVGSPLSRECNSSSALLPSCGLIVGSGQSAEGWGQVSSAAFRASASPHSIEGNSLEGAAFGDKCLVGVTICGS